MLGARLSVCKLYYIIPRGLTVSRFYCFCAFQNVDDTDIHLAILIHILIGHVCRTSSRTGNLIEAYRGHSFIEVWYRLVLVIKQSFATGA